MTLYLLMQDRVYYELRGEVRDEIRGQLTAQGESTQPAVSFHTRRGKLVSTWVCSRGSGCGAGGRPGLSQQHHVVLVYCQLWPLLKQNRKEIAHMAEPWSYRCPTCIPWTGTTGVPWLSFYTWSAWPGITSAGNCGQARHG